MVVGRSATVWDNGGCARQDEEDEQDEEEALKQAQELLDEDEDIEKLVGDAIAAAAWGI